MELETIFSRHAFSALVRAHAHFAADRWALGIEATSEAALRSALSQANTAIAKRASVSNETVSRLMPAVEIEEALADLGPKQQKALDVARDYASSFTSFLARSLHVEDNSAGAYLHAVAARHYDDDFISKPIEAFAEALSKWQALMDRCAKTIDTDGVIASSVKRRRLLRAGMSMGALLALSLSIAASAWWWLVAEAARKRLQAELNKPDPCTTGAIADWNHATQPQIAKREERTLACSIRRQTEARLAECSQLASHVESNRLSAEDEKLAGESALLLRRIAMEALTRVDLMVEAGAMPCQDTPAGLRLWGAFGSVASKSSQLWAEAEEVSGMVAELLSQKQYALSLESQSQLVNHADSVARRAVVSGFPADMARARSLCELQNKLRVEPIGRGCQAVDRLTVRR